MSPGSQKTPSMQDLLFRKSCVNLFSISNYQEPTLIKFSSFYSVRFISSCTIWYKTQEKNEFWLHWAFKRIKPLRDQQLMNATVSNAMTCASWNGEATQESRQYCCRQTPIWEYCYYESEVNMFLLLLGTVDFRLKHVKKTPQKIQLFCFFRHMVDTVNQPV